MAARLHRLAIRIPADHIAAVRAYHGPEGQRRLMVDLETRLARLGWHDVVVMQDPTDETRATATAFRGLGAPRETDGVITVEGAEPLRSAPNASASSLRAPDPGMSPDVTVTLAHALAAEENQRHLRGFAQTLEPAFVTSASLLRAKAELLDRRRLRKPGPSPEALERPLADLSAGLGAPVLSTWGRLCPEVGLLDAPSRPPHPESVARGAHALAAYRNAQSLPQDVVNDQVRMAAAILAAEGAIEPGDAPAVVVGAARDAVRHLGSGVYVVDPLVIEALCPLTGREGYVSPSSLQLALTTMKPKWSRITDTREAARLCRELSMSTDKRALMARAELSRATKAIERQRWVTWYQTLANRFPTLSRPGASGAPRIGSFKLSRARRAS